MEAPIDRDVRALLVFLIPWTLACALVFLAVSDFFGSWRGHAVSVRPAATEEPAVYQVLIVGEDGPREVTWPADVVQGLGLPVDPLAIPPREIPPERPATSKMRFQLHFLVEAPGEEEAWRTVPTTSPRSLALAVVLLFLGLGVRNMIWSGSPASIRRREAYLPPQQAAPGSPATTSQGPPQKRPPPPKRRRGPRR